jgi:hypothetical protein
MSPQKLHAMHGRDHRTGGADPIPGIGAGGVDWEDVGTSYAPFTIQNTDISAPQQSISNGARVAFNAIDNVVLQVTAAAPTTVSLKNPGYYIISGYLYPLFNTGGYQLQLLWGGGLTAVAHASAYSDGGFTPTIGLVEQQVVSQSMQPLYFELFFSGAARTFNGNFDISRLK